MIRASHAASDASAYAQRHGSASCRGINARPCCLAANVHCVTVTAVHHPIFARCYGLVSRFVEHAVGERRDELLAGLCGRVIEVGAGNGMNFRHYPVTRDEVVAVEPEGYLRHLADHAARDAPVPVSMRAGLAENLPLKDGEFDAGVASLVLCSVAEQTPALAELRRVLKPGVSCASSSTCAPRPRARPASRLRSIASACSRSSPAAVTARGRPWRRSSPRASRSSACAGSSSGRHGCSPTRSCSGSPGLEASRARFTARRRPLRRHVAAWCRFTFDSLYRNARIVSTLRLGLANTGIFVRSVPDASQLTTRASDARGRNVPVGCGSVIP